MKLKLSIEDTDTEDRLKGNVKVTIYDITKDKNVKLPITDEPKSDSNNVSGSNMIKKINSNEITVQTAHTYTNRKLRIKVTQNNIASLNGLEYDDSTMNFAEFIVETDDLGDITNVSPANGTGTLTNPLNLPSNIIYGGRNGQVMSFTFKNKFKYNFAIKVKAVDANGNPLKGIRIYNIGYRLDYGNRVLPQALGTTVWRKYGSSKTDENGETTLKVFFKQESDFYIGNGSNANKDRVFALSEYEAANGYILQENIR